MIHSGLVSITFRQLSPGAIVDLVAQSGLEGIEWGGDIHVPHGDTLQAQWVRRMTEDAGLSIPSYGSYYRVGHGEPVPFEAVVETALALGAPLIRVWAGKLGSERADTAYWGQVVADSRHIAELAAASGLVVAYEFHGNTLTDTNASARRLLEMVSHPALQSYWQPRGLSLQEALESLEAVRPWLSHLHVFAWQQAPGQVERLPLAAGEALWPPLFERAAHDGRERFAMIEFVRNDEPAQFLEDARTLQAWLSKPTD